MREPDGLALSSRNQYLSRSDRARALAISRSLRAAQELFDAGATDVQDLLKQLRPELSKHVDSIDYLEIRDAMSLEPIDNITDPAVVLIAAFVSGTRLIDNIMLEDNQR